MVKIQTVKGPVDLDQLGDTMMHEHVFFVFDEKVRAASMSFGRRELNRLAACGARTLVDVGPLPHRKMDWYKEIAPQVKLNIILSTGFYSEKTNYLGDNSVPEHLHRLSEDAYVERFTKQLVEGIDDSGLRAGVIKVACSKATLTPWEQKVLRAAGRVQKATGVPICTHAIEGARQQFDALVAAGADPESIYMSHVEAEFGWEGRTLVEEAKYLEKLGREGASFFFNNFSLWRDTPDEDLAFLMHYLLDKGLLNRILFGIDGNFHFDDQGSIWWEGEDQFPEYGCRDYAFTYTGAVPLLRRWGFTEAEIHTCLAENPKRLFSTTRI